jgi:cytochrome bd-type quinol oxidase subunit 1
MASDCGSSLCFSDHDFLWSCDDLYWSGLSVCFFFKKEWLIQKLAIKNIFIATPFGYIALEAGWTVTEVGRQPWIIYGIMRTVDAVTPMPGIQYSFYFFTAILYHYH